MNFIIVLGSSDPDIRKARVEKAVNYYKHLLSQARNFEFYENSAPRDIAKIIFSGKGRTMTNSTEATDMLRIALSLGVPESVCATETESQNTRENIVNTLNLLVSHGWFKPTSYINKPTFTICTSQFHAPRALLIAMEVLSPFGAVMIVHTGEYVPSEIAEREKILLDQCMKNFTLPKLTVKY